LDAVGAKRLIRVAELDLFRLGSDEAYEQGYAVGFEEGAAESQQPSTSG
jgi:coenzyme F420-0:L-glutamate ligase/coenzyme F420-1:gamma-L-glutamate ligase